MFFNSIEQALKLPAITNLEELSKLYLVAHESGFDHTLKSALRVSTIGLAFITGYRSALQLLVPSLDVSRWASICVTESQGNHPRSLATTVDDYGVLNGHKTFVALPKLTPQLIVIATKKTEESLKQPKIQAVLIDALDNHSIVFSGSSTNMLPDVPHGAVTFNDAKGTILSGDGYTDYSKRFRVLEDSFVLAALCALHLRYVHEYGLPVAIASRAMSIIFSLKACLQHSDGLDSPIYHLILSDLYQGFGQLIKDFEANLSKLPNDVVASWKRDKTLFTIAQKARSARTQKAEQWWSQVSSG